MITRALSKTRLVRSFIVCNKHTKHCSYTLRRYATQSANKSAEENPKFMEAPAVIPGTSGIYAMLLFENAYKDGGDSLVKRVEKEINVVAWSVRKDTEWEIVTKTPFFSPKEREEFVTERLKSLGCSQWFTNIILELIEKKDINKLDQIRVDYEEIMRAYRKEVDVILVTKTPLSSELLDYYKKKYPLKLLKTRRQHDIQA